jgi:uncharacterized Ntn-hydrolase superfamily protein
MAISAAHRGRGFCQNGALSGRSGPIRCAEGAELVIPVHTYSIVARDPATGELGVAVQSHYFSVGSVVPWGEPGVGVVATQSFPNLAYGAEGLALMRSGRTAPEALAELVGRDPEPDLRQVAMVDAVGNAAAHTGERCIAAAGHLVGDGFSVQANIMVDDGVWPAMAAAYLSATGDLADRLVTALEAAQEAGGDLRGQQSAALLIVAGEPPERPGEGKRFDLRVEDHPAPLAELRRLLPLARAYRYVDDADAAVGQGRFEAAAAAYQAAMELAPEIAELKLWSALSMLRMGREEEAIALFEAAFRADPGLVELVPRVAALGLMPDDPALLERIVGR